MEINRKNVMHELASIFHHKYHLDHPRIDKSRIFILQCYFNPFIHKLNFPDEHLSFLKRNKIYSFYNLLSIKYQKQYLHFMHFKNFFESRSLLNHIVINLFS